MFQLLGIYFSNQNVLKGLTELHQSIHSITHIRQLRQLLITQRELLAKSALKNFSDDELVVVNATKAKIDEFFLLALDQSKNSPAVHQLIRDARTALDALNLQFGSFKDGRLVHVSSTVIDQYMLEIQDHLGKVQLVLAEESDRIFDRIYGERFTPFIVGLILSLLFLFFSIWIWINLKRRIDKPIQKLIETTQSLADGNLGIRAHISKADEIGALTYAFNVMADRIEKGMTEQNRTAEALAEAKNKAEAANNAKSAFLANMSHEIRTPLGAVMGFADLIVDPKTSSSDKESFLLAIKRNGELLTKIINDILDLSKIEAGKMQILNQNVCLHEILSDTKSLLDLLAQEKGIELKFETDVNAPKFFKTDSLRLRQILINIIGNAIKFTKKGSVQVNARSAVGENNKSQLMFIVTDTGRGISQEQSKQLFAAFSQGDVTSTREFGGTGLGLALSKHFAQLLGGDVVLSKSVLGDGSTFVVTIKLDPVSSPLTTIEQTEPMISHSGGHLPLDEVKVLLAEDSPDNQILICHLLKLAGASVDLVFNGKEAIDLALKQNYDVVLMDIQMPIMDGYEATSYLRQQGYRGKIIALTAHALNEDKERSLKVGFDDHLGKPINRDLLIKLIYQNTHASQ